MQKSIDQEDIENEYNAGEDKDDDNKDKNKNKDNNRYDALLSGL